MKIAFLTGNLSNGGAQRVTSIIANGLANLNHEVSLFVFAKYGQEYSISDAVNLRYMKKTKSDYDQYPLFLRLCDVRRFLTEEKPDVAVGFMEAGYALYLASKGLGIKTVASVRIHPEKILKAKGFRAVINRKWFKNADAVVFQTERQREYVKDCGWHNCVVIPNPAPETLINHKFSERTPQKDSLRIMMVGRLAKQKNYPMALKAFKRIKEDGLNYVVDIFGKGEEENNLNKLIIDYSLTENVFFRGWTQNIIGEMMQHDVYVLSSDYEGMPNSLMEAMGTGMVCVATDCFSGPAEMIEDGKNGFLVPIGDYVSLATKISAIGKLQVTDFQRLCNEARYTVLNRYNGGTIVKLWENLFFDLLAVK